MIKKLIIDFIVINFFVIFLFLIVNEIRTINKHKESFTVLKKTVEKVNVVKLEEFYLNSVEE